MIYLSGLIFIMAIKLTIVIHLKEMPKKNNNILNELNIIKNKTFIQNFCTRK